MCGIIGYIINQKSEKKDFYKKKFFSNFQRQNHRGPDFKQEVNFNYKELKIQLGFNRLSSIESGFGGEFAIGPFWRLTRMPRVNVTLLVFVSQGSCGRRFKGCGSLAIFKVCELGD